MVGFMRSVLLRKWIKLAKLRQTRRTGPAKISLTVFGYRNDPMHPRMQTPPGSAVSSLSNVPAATNAADSANSEPRCPADGSAAETISDSPMSDGSTGMVQSEWAPKIVPKSGPKFFGFGQGSSKGLTSVSFQSGHPSP